MIFIPGREPLLKHQSDPVLDYFLSVDPTPIVVVLALLAVIISLGVIGLLVWRLARPPSVHPPPNGESE
jgi:hypothetical protein